VLRNTSLNERQKDKIVEAISKLVQSGSKDNFETLQSTVEARQNVGPQSLSEAISRRSSILRASSQETKPADPCQDRMKKLAGILIKL
jgi:predicted negative regulator of RcsB-dependent stress response